MSINKPTLTNPWASSAPGNIASPGSVNETGIPFSDAAKSIPCRWLNWILNKIDTTCRYLVGRGVPDFDASETYRVGDRVQFNGSTWVCKLAPTSHQSPIDTDYWESWGFTDSEFNGKFSDLFVPLFTTSFAAAFSAGMNTQLRIVDVKDQIDIDAGYGVTVQTAKAYVITTGRILFLQLTGGYANLSFPIGFSDDVGFARTGMAFPFARGSGQAAGSGTSVRLETGQGGVLNVTVGGIGGLGATWSVDLMIVAP